MVSPVSPQKQQQQQQQPRPASPNNNGIVMLDTDEVKKQKGPASRSYKLPIMALCAILGYGLCQLDLTLGTDSPFTTTPTGMRGFTTNNYLNNGKTGNVKKPILQISVLGERNSGTRWTWG
jgi:hypothetical protein